MTSLSQIQPVLQTNYLECPFAWRAESYLLNREIEFFPQGTSLTISFYTPRYSKVLGYIPLIGTMIGVRRIFKGFQEYQLFKNSHWHLLSNRSIHWIIRGGIELTPILGGLVCIVTDLMATLIPSYQSNLLYFPDENPCGYCYTCGFCQC